MTIRDSGGCSWAIGSVVVVASVLATTACGTQRSPNAAQEPGTATIEHQLSVLSARVNGTMADKSVVDFLANQAMNDPLTACLANQGFDYSPASVNGWKGMLDVGSEETWTAPLQSHVISVDAQARVVVARQENMVANEPPPGGSIAVGTPYGDAYRTCMDSMGDPTSVTGPQGAEALGAELLRTVDAVESDMGGNATYNSCMGSAGYDTTGDDVDGFQGLLLLLRNHVPSDVPGTGKATTPVWDGFLAYEQAALDADEACRAAGHADAMAQLAPKLDDFAANHATEIAAIQQGWAQLRQQALGMGWRP